MTVSKAWGSSIGDERPSAKPTGRKTDYRQHNFAEMVRVLPAQRGIARGKGAGVLVRLAAGWTDPFGIAHNAGDVVDIDVITLAELEERGVVHNMSEPEEWNGPGEQELQEEQWNGPGEAADQEEQWNGPGVAEEEAEEA
jgi:hypothetical protein